MKPGLVEAVVPVGVRRAYAGKPIEIEKNGGENACRRAMSAAVNAPFFTSSVAVRQLRTRAMRAPGSPTPLRSSASATMPNNFKVSRGGSVTQRVMASTPPGASRRK